MTSAVHKPFVLPVQKAAHLTVINRQKYPILKGLAGYPTSCKESRAPTSLKFHLMISIQQGLCQDTYHDCRLGGTSILVLQLIM